MPRNSYNQPICEERLRGIHRKRSNGGRNTFEQHTGFNQRACALVNGGMKKDLFDRLAVRHGKWSDVGARFMEVNAVSSWFAYERLLDGSPQHVRVREIY